MNLSLVHEVSDEAIKRMFDVKNQPLFIEKLRFKFRDFQLHNTHAKSEVLAVMLGGGKKPQNIFISLDSAMEMAVKFKK